MKTIPINHSMKALAKNTLNPHPGSRLVTAVAAMSFFCCGAALGAADWDGAKVTRTDLLAGETKHGKFAYSFASVNRDIAISNNFLLRFRISILTPIAQA
ncbi:MAG: hypothetical protein NTW21_27100 [Verrucomicrobia bacterium]|nr:hypothetical protein [Verrucomicrobiota bacterium]